MKNYTLLPYIFLPFFTFILSTGILHAQDLNKDRNIDSSFVFLDQQYISSKILLNNHSDSTLRTYRLDGSQFNSVSNQNWNDLNYFINRGCLLESEIKTIDDLLEIDKNVRHKQLDKNQTLAIPIFISNYTFNILKPNAISDSLIYYSGGYYHDVSPGLISPYDERRVIYAGVFPSEIPESKLTFLFSAQTYLSNTPFSSLEFIELDANDGAGFRTVHPDEPFTINYSSPGFKEMKMVVHTSTGIYKSGLQVQTVSPNQTCLAPYGPDQSPWCSAGSNRIGAIDPVSHDIVYANTYLKYGPEGTNKLDKPFILVEGIDFGMNMVNNSLQNGDLGFCQMFGGGNNKINLYFNDGYDHDDYFFMKKYPQLIETLRSEGYDVIMLDFYDGAEKIEKNYMLLVELIKLVNQHKSGCEPIVVAGASMGGQIARLALTYMEQHGMDHEACMYISVDSPHKGAYIPAGLQYMLANMSSMALDVISSAATIRLNKTLKRPAAMELLNNNIFHESLALRTSYYSLLSGTGYPHVRKVGIANGCSTGDGQGFPNGAHLFEFNWSPLICLNYPVVGYNVYASPGNNQQSIFTGHAPHNLLPVLFCLTQGALCFPCMAAVTMPYVNVIGQSGTAGWDNCPGGKRRTLYSLERDLKTQLHDNSALMTFTDFYINAPQYNHSFIPTNSALDINSHDLLLSFNRYTLVSQGLTPFDTTHAPEHINEQHSEATDENIAFLLAQLHQHETAIPSQLSSSGMGTSIYNYVYTYQKIGSTEVTDGTTLCFNSNVQANFTDYHFTPVQGSTLELKTTKCDPIVVVEENGKMILGDAGPNNIAKVTFTNGSKLILKTGSKLIIHDHSELIIESGATFICEQGVEIILEGSGSLLDVQNVQTQIELGANTPSNTLQINSGNLSDGGLMKLAGGNVLMNDQSKLILENTKLELGEYTKLKFNSGSAIELNGSTANIDFQGLLEIGNETCFTFNGEGFVSFSKMNPPYNNVLSNINSSMAFHGSSKNDEVLRINQKALFLPDNMTGFRVKSGRISLGEHTRFVLPAGTNTPLFVNPDIQFNYARVTSTSGLNNGHQGIELKGQESVSIVNSVFEYGEYGINAYLYVKGHPLQISQSDFNENETGLNTYGKGVYLNKVNFNKNGIGWNALGAELPSLMVNGTAIENGAGINFVGTSTANLLVKNSEINNNIYGLVDDGASVMTVSCSEIKNNSVYGIHLRHAAKLNMSSDLAAGYSDARGNDKTIYCENASALYLDNGYNNFTPQGSPNTHCEDDQLGCFPAIEGTLSLGYNGPLHQIGSATITGGDAINYTGETLYYQDDIYCTNDAFRTLAANHNIWSAFSTMHPRFDQSVANSCWHHANNGFSGEYSLYTSYQCPLHLTGINGTQSCARILLHDDFPSSSSCPANPHGTPDPQPNGSGPVSATAQFIPYRGNIRLNTPSFQETSLGDAINKALAATGTGETARNEEALKLFSEILNYREYRNLTQADFLLLDFAFERYSSALGYAYSNGDIIQDERSSRMPDEAQSILDYQKKMLSIFTPAADRFDVYFQRFPLMMERAQIYRLAGQRDAALAIIADVLTWTRPEDLEYTEFWQCLIQNELHVLNNNEEQNQTTCSMQNANARLAKHPKENVNQSDSFTAQLSVSPNPSSGKFSLRLSGKEEITQVLVYNLLGEPVRNFKPMANNNQVELDLLNCTNGIYFVKVETANKSFITKLIHE